MRMSALAKAAAGVWDSIGSDFNMALGRFRICQPEAATSTCEMIAPHVPLFLKVFRKTMSKPCNRVLAQKVSSTERL